MIASMLPPRAAEQRDKRHTWRYVSAAFATYAER